MSCLVDLSADPESPFCVDPSDICFVRFSMVREVVALFSHCGLMMNVDQSPCFLEPDVVQRRMAQAGIPLVVLPLRLAQNEHFCLVNPRAITFMAVSRAGAGGARSALIGIEGYGHAETARLMPTELEDVLLSLSAAGKNMLSFGAGEAYARWMTPERLLIDPSSVTSVYQDAHQIMVEMKNCGRLEVESSPVNRREVLRRIAYDRPGVTAEDALTELNLRQARTDFTRRSDIAQRVMLACGDMVQVPFSSCNLYLRLSDLSCLRTAEDASGPHLLIDLKRRDKSDNCTRHYRLPFADADGRDKALAFLKGGLREKQRRVPSLAI